MRSWKNKNPRCHTKNVQLPWMSFGLPAHCAQYHACMFCCASRLRGSELGSARIALYALWSSVHCAAV